MGIINHILGRDVTTDVVEVLTEQHREIDGLFEQIQARTGDRRALFAHLADLLAAHAAVEETLFYPAVMAKDTSGQLHEAVEEHLAIKRVLADLLTMKLDAATFAAKLNVLKEEVAHHAHREEEAKLFPKVLRMFDRDERAALGGELVAKFEELIAASPRDNVPSEISSAAPLPHA